MNTDKPIVSICMITYNHEKFIAEAIEGVLIQETSCSYQLVIGEDFSTDNTRKICEEYAVKYPNKIKLLPSDKNYRMMPNFIRTLEACNGKYIALCEGDDYWTDPLKLQKQVDFLEENEAYSICFHDAIVYSEFDNSRIVHSKTMKSVKDQYTFGDVVTSWFMPTCSVLFRGKDLPDDLSIFLQNIFSGDILLSALLTRNKKIFHLQEVMSCYRRHEGGVSQNLSEYSLLTKHLDLLNKLKEYFFDKDRTKIKILDQAIIKNIRRFLDISIEQQDIYLGLSLLKRYSITNYMILSLLNRIVNKRIFRFVNWRINA